MKPEEETASDKEIKIVVIMSNLMDNIKSLRESTGAGFLDCKKALQENNNEIEKSIDFLRKKGLAKAVKKSSREAKEGASWSFYE